MDRRRLLAALAATGVAGCLRLSGQDGTSTGTVNQPPTETAGSSTTEPPGTDRRATDTPADGNYPIGLGEDGVSPLLVDKHMNELNQTSFTLAHARQDLTRGDILNNVNITVESQQALINRQDENVDNYVDITSGRYDPVTWRATSGRQQLYGHHEDCCIANPKNLTGVRVVLGWAIQAGDFEPPEPGDETAAYTIRADAMSDPDPLIAEFDADQVQAFSAEGKVTQRGVIREFTATVTFVRDENLHEVESDLELSEMGGTTVQEPSWVETAGDRAPSLRVAIREDNLGIEYVHEGGDPVVAESTVGVHSHGDQEWVSGSEHSRLDEPLEPGETLVAYAEGDSVTHARGDIPSDASPRSLEDEGWTNLRSPASANYFKKAFRLLR